MDKEDMGKGDTALRNSSHNHEVAAAVVQPGSALLGADHDVLDPRAVPTRVDPRLDGECHSRFERLRVARHDVWILVRLQADAVPGPVDEEGAIAGLADQVACGGIDGLRTDA